MDVWEHSYYLKHQNVRLEYVSDWWGVVCWEEVAKLLVYWHDRNTTQEHTRRSDEL